MPCGVKCFGREESWRTGQRKGVVYGLCGLNCQGKGQRRQMNTQPALPPTACYQQGQAIRGTVKAWVVAEKLEFGLEDSDKWTTSTWVEVPPMYWIWSSFPDWDSYSTISGAGTDIFSLIIATYSTQVRTGIYTPPSQQPQRDLDTPPPPKRNPQPQTPCQGIYTPLPLPTTPRRISIRPQNWNSG